MLWNIFANHYHYERQTDEIEKYMMIKEVDVDIYPFKWWVFQALNFPILFELSKKYLAIPATSAASEWLFSNAENVMTVKYINLLSFTFEYLIFCK